MKKNTSKNSFDNSNNLKRELPMTDLERVTKSPKFDNSDWYNFRRKTFNSVKDGTVENKCMAIPMEYMKNENIFHKSFIPSEANVLYRPRIVGRPSPKYIKRFSGKRIIPANNFVQIYNGDGRQIFYDDTYPWCCIGYLQTKNGWGTATLVGDNFVITAGHVIGGLWSPGQPLTETITFTPAMNIIPPSNKAKSILGDDWFANVVNIAAWEEVYDGTIAGYDMAICELDKPLGTWLGYFGSRSFDSDWEDGNYWEHVGYPFDMSPNGFKPCYELNVAVYDEDSDDYSTQELDTEADIASGQSGGPLFAFFQDGGPQILGVLSGREETDYWLWQSNEAVFSGGNGLNSLIRWGRDNW